LSTLLESNLYSGQDETLNTSEIYTETLHNGYNFKLNGWNQIREANLGYSREDLGAAQAKVTDLECGKIYSWALYQYTSDYGRGRNATFFFFSDDIVGIFSKCKNFLFRKIKKSSQTVSAHHRVSFAYVENF